MVQNHNRRAVLKQLGTVGIGLGALGASTRTARAQYCYPSTEMELGKRYQIEPSHGTHEYSDDYPSYNGTAHGKSYWGIGWTGYDDSTYRFAIIGIFHTYGESDYGGADPFLAQDKVRCEYELWDSDDYEFSEVDADRNASRLYALDDKISWRNWYDNNAGTVDSLSDAKDAIRDNYQSEVEANENYWVSTAVQTGGVGLGVGSYLASSAALGVAGTAVGAASLAASIAGIEPDSYNHTYQQSQLEPYHTWEINGAALTVHVSEFEVKVGGSRLALDIEHGYVPQDPGWPLDAVGAANVGGWRLWIYDDAESTPPTICKRETRVDPEGPKGAPL